MSVWYRILKINLRGKFLLILRKPQVMNQGQNNKCQP